MPKFDKATLNAIAEAMCTAAGLPSHCMLLEENEDGSFTVDVLGKVFTDTLPKVLAFAANRLHEIALEQRDDAEPSSGMSP